MSKLPSYSTIVKRTGRDIAVTLEARVEAVRERVFDYVAAEGVLPEVLTGYTWFLPAVVSSSGNTGPWDTPGSSRRVHLKDGSTAREEVTAYDRPAFFAYKSSKFTFALRHLATGATGEWWFTPDGPRHSGLLDVHIQGQRRVEFQGVTGLRPSTLVGLHGGLPSQHSESLYCITRFVDASSYRGCKLRRNRIRELRQSGRASVTSTYAS